MQWTFDFLVQLCNKSHKKLMKPQYFGKKGKGFSLSLFVFRYAKLKRIKWLFADIDELVDKISFNILIWCQLFCQEIIKYKNKSIICWNFRISPGHGSLFSHAMKLSSQSAKKGQWVSQLLYAGTASQTLTSTRAIIK